MEESATNPRPIRYAWKEISDLPQDVEALRDRELESLFDVWNKDENRLDAERMKVLNAQIAREWAIETGIVENVYSLDRRITQTLIRRGIDAAYIPHDATNLDPELVARIIQSHADTLEGLFAFIRGERALSTGYIKELHAALLRHQETISVVDQFGNAFKTKLEKGTYKTTPNNPTRPDGTFHEYCPPEHVASEMDRLIQLHREHDERGITPHIEAAWLHHAFTQIHPFQDGNGRVARALATLVFIKRMFFPLVVTRDDHERYIDALEVADQGDLSDLVRLFARIQKRALTRAITMAVDVKPVASVDEAIAVTRDMLLNLGRIIPTQYLAAKETARGLVTLTMGRFENLTAKLTDEIGRVNSTYSFVAGTLGAAPVNELDLIGEKLQYVPNTDDYLASPVVTFTSSGVTSRIVVSFHSVGPAFRGLIAVAGYFQAGDKSPIPLSEDIFRISYQELRGEAEGRYTHWLDQILIKGLAEWRRTLA